MLAPDQRYGTYYCQDGDKAHLTGGNCQCQIGDLNLSTTKLLAPDGQKLLVWNKTVEVVKNATDYKFEISLATNDSHVVQTPKICTAVECIFDIFITALCKL